jgi:biotin carboxylase
MDTIVFIGSNKSGTSREAIQIAEQMGYFTILFTDREKFLEQREEFPDVHQMIYLKYLQLKELILEQLDLLQQQGKRIKACLSLIDPFVYSTAILSEELGLATLSTGALYKMEEKTRFRKELQSLNVNPWFNVVSYKASVNDIYEDFKKRLPFIIKSPQSFGSKDVYLGRTEKDLEMSLHLLKRQFPKTSLLVEEYLEGPQYLVEVLVLEGKIHIIAIVEQEITNLNNRFIVTGYVFPAALSDDQYTKLEVTIKNILTTLEMVHGSCHLEMRWVKGEWKLIEINPRMSGGAMNQIIIEGTGINLVKEIIKMNLGQEPEINKTKDNHIYAHFITVNATGRLFKVTGKNRALSYEGVKEVFIKPRKGNILNPPLSMGDRYAYVIASANTPNAAKRTALTAVREIKFYLEPF